MSESILDIRRRLMPGVRVSQTEPPAPENLLDSSGTSSAPEVSAPRAPGTSLDPEVSAFAVESQETGKILITMPAKAREAAASAEDFLLRLSGRLVEAEKANLNGAFWSHGDLEFGLPSVALGPLNWLHQERKVVGVLTQAQLIKAESEQANITTTNGISYSTSTNLPLSRPVNPYIRADAVLWKWLYPGEAREVAQAAEARQLWYSMECVARRIECVGENGCGKVVDYRERSSANACSHMREHSAHRRLIDPIFQGAAIIVPPVKPGWADADLSVTRQAAALVEKQEIDLPGLSTAQAEAMVAQVVAYANSTI